MADETSNGNELITRLTREAAANRHRGKEYKAQLEAERKAKEALQSQFDELKAQFDAKPVPSDDAVKYKAELDAMKHRSAFTQVAKSLGVADSAMDATWKLSDYKAEGDAKEEVIKDIVSRTLETNPFLKGEPVQQPLQAGPGFSKGKPASTTKKLVNKSDFDDPRWRVANGKWLSEAIKADDVEIVDD